MLDRKYDYFLSIYEYGNITKAANKNFIAQPSMTQYLNRLEASLDVKLFNRETKQLTLTRAGEIYLEYVKKCIALDNELEEKLSSLKPSVQGTVTVGIALQMQVLANELISPFLDKYPSITLRINDEASPALERMVYNGHIDCAIIFVEKPRYTKLTYHFLKKERLLLVCSKNDPLAVGQDSSPDHPIPITLDDLSNRLFCQMEKGFIVRDMSDAFLSRHGLNPSRFITMTSMDAIVSTVCGSQALAFLPEYVITNSMQKDRLAFLQAGDESLEMTLALVSPKQSQLSPPAHCFTVFVTDTYVSVDG